MTHQLLGQHFSSNVKRLLIVMVLLVISMSQLPEIFAQQLDNLYQQATVIRKKKRIITLPQSATGKAQATHQTSTGSCIWDMKKMQWTGMMSYSGLYLSGGVYSGSMISGFVASGASTGLISMAQWTGNWSGFVMNSMLLPSVSGVVMYEGLKMTNHWMMVDRCVWSSGGITYPTEREYLSGLLLFSGELQELPPLFTGVILIGSGGGGGSSVLNTGSTLVTTTGSSPIANTVHNAPSYYYNGGTIAKKTRQSAYHITSKEEFSQLMDDDAIVLDRQSVKRSRDTGAYNKAKITSEITYTSSNSDATITIPGDTTIFTNQGQELKIHDFIVQSSDQSQNNLHDNTVLSVIDVGTIGDHLIFTKPVMISYDSDLPNGSLVSVKVKHGDDVSWNNKGISTTSTTTCDLEGNVSIPGDTVMVQGGKITFYICGASTFIIDDLDSKPTAAYGLRKLVSTHTGPVVRVRRSSDNTQQDIGLTSDGYLNTGALLSFVGSADGFVTIWYDQSGNGKHATQNITTLQPRLVVGGIIESFNTRPIVRYVAEGQTLETSMPVVSNESNNAINLVYDASTVARTPFSLNGSDQSQRFTAHADVLWDYTSYWSAMSTYPRFGYSTIPVNFKINTFVHSTILNTQYISENGAIRASRTGAVTANAPFSQGILQIGATLYGAPYKFVGSIGELIVFADISLSTQQRNIIEQSQAVYFGLTGTYAADAPTNLIGVPSNNKVSLSWNAPTYGGGSAITDYVVQYKLSSSSVWSTFADGVSTTTSTIVTGLTNGLNYDFRVISVNGNGMGAPSPKSTFIPYISYQGPLYKWSSDAGVITDGTRVSQWNNFGSNGAVYLSQSDPNCRTYYTKRLLNNTPVVSWNNRDNHYGNPGANCESLFSNNAPNGFVIPADINFTGINIFMVKTTNYRRSSGNDFSMGSNVLNQGNFGDGRYMIDFNNEAITWQAGRYSWGGPDLTNPTLGRMVFTGATNKAKSDGLEYRNKPMMWGFTFNSASAGGDGQRIRTNGKDVLVSSVATNASNSRAFLSTDPNTNTINSQFTMGYIDNPRNGDLAELLIYTGVITPTERTSIESYLSLKRGIPFEPNVQHYRDGSQSIIRNNTINSGFNNEVVGFGRDNTTSLNTSSAGYSQIPSIPNSIALPVLPSNNVGTITTVNVIGATGSTVTAAEVPAGYPIYYNSPAGVVFAEDRMYEITYWVRSKSSSRNIRTYIASPQGSWFDGIANMQIFGDMAYTMNTSWKKVTIKFYAKNLQGTTNRIYLDQDQGSSDALQYYGATIKEYSPMGTDNIRIQTSNTLVDGQYSLIGHNGGTIAWSSGGVVDVINRKWLLQKTGPSASYTTTISIPSNVVSGMGSSGYVIVDDDSNLTNGIVSYTPLVLSAGRYSASNIAINQGNYYISLVRGDAAGLVINPGTICIESPALAAFSGTINTSGNIWQNQYDYFKVLDSKGSNSGYYTTIAITDLVGGSGRILSKAHIARKGDAIATLSGSTNTRVVVGPMMAGSYIPATGTVTFIKRDAAANNSLTGIYGSKLRLQYTIPAYQTIGTYMGTITYTLYEN